MSVEDCISELSKLTVGILSQPRECREFFCSRTEHNGRKLQEELTRIIKRATAPSNDCLPYLQSLLGDFFFKSGRLL